MIELIQFPWSPFCLVQRRILEFAGVPFKAVNIPSGDRTRVWRLTKQRYYGVPILKDGRTVLFEVDDDSQVIAKYLDDKLSLGLFPRELEGVQNILWRYSENEVESCTFRLNDAQWREVVPKTEQLSYLRHKERKFGRGCLDQWGKDRKQWQRALAAKLLPFEEMLMHHPFLLGDRPRFVDFDLFGMLTNYLYSGHYHLPARHTRLHDWYARMQRVKASQFVS
jgi:glutathione S-transferase